MKIAILLSALAVSAYGQTGYDVTTFTVPGATQTGGGNINNVGQVSVTAEMPAAGGTFTYVSFLRSASGDFVPLIPPGSNGNVYATTVANDGVVAGYYDTSDTTTSGFTYKNGVYTSFLINNESTQLLSVKDRNEYLAYYTGALSTVLVRPNQPLDAIIYPTAQLTAPEFINDIGVVVGSYLDDVGLIHGFTFLNNTYTTLDIRPGSRNTTPYCINNKGEVVGSYSTTFTLRGFIYAKGHFRDFAISGARDTYLNGINDAGQLSGTYVNSANVQIGFTATPIAQ